MASLVVSIKKRNETSELQYVEILPERAKEYIMSLLAVKSQAHLPFPLSNQHRTTMKVANVKRTTNNIKDNTSLKEISRDLHDAKDKGIEMIYFVYDYSINKTNGALNIVFIHPVIVSLQLQ